MAQYMGIIDELNVSEVFYEPVSQDAFSLADIPRREERVSDTIDDIVRSASEIVVDMTRRIMGACVYSDFGEVGTSATA